MAQINSQLFTRVADIGLGVYVLGLALGVVTSNLSTLFGVTIGFITIIMAYGISAPRLYMVEEDLSLYSDFGEVVSPFVHEFKKYLAAIMSGVLLVALYVQAYPF